MQQASEESKTLVDVIKIFCMIFMFLIVVIVGNIPIRLAAFKSNKILLSFTSAFSGGLFFSVGMMHLLPEAVESFDEYFNDQQQIKPVDQDQYPFAFLITTLSFSFVLWIEKIAVSKQHDHHQLSDMSELSKVRPSPNEENNEQVYVELSPEDELIIHNEDDCIRDAEQQFKNQVSVKLKIAKQISQSRQIAQSVLQKSYISNNITPYILQIAIGIHAIFEGLAIGIENKPGACLGLAIAVSCHKWAEGLTLGLAFRQAGIDTKTASIMICIQAIMNPIGIGIGLILSSSGPLMTGIFYSISAGTFIYISSVEMIVQEFNIARYKWCKYLIFLLAIGFVSSLWFIEKLTG